MASNDLFTSLISDIKSYSGKDPLLPWLRGIRRLQDSLPQKLLEEKLPRFLQKCAQAFQSDDRYRNEPRYLRVWLKLMDFVEDPRELLRAMEANRIGTKHALFYQAYALYYEKNKKFEEAEKMYHLGVQKHADPMEELEKAFEQFLQRMERHRKRKQHQEKRLTKRVSDRNRVSRISGEMNDETEIMVDRSRSKHEVTTGGVSDGRRMPCSDDTVVGKFVDTAIVGKSEAEDACHHGLVDPTINMKEAMSAINSMFREPLEIAPMRRGSRQCQQKENNTNGFQVFVDENLDKGGKSKCEGVVQQSRTSHHQSHQEPLSIFIDDDQDSLEQNEVQNITEDSSPSASHESAFGFLKPKDVPSESPNGFEVEGSSRPRFREDTMMVRRIVGTTISEDPQVENACHHGLVEPTINLREAMDDINNMFGKPIDFVRSRRAKRQDKVPEKKQDLGGFCILPDDDTDDDDEDSDDNLEQQQVQIKKELPGKSKDTDLFETTVFTKQAMDDINKMFGMPLDF